ncbi:MAG: hypothetical protein ABDH32_07040 [Candidatus Caldarchaeales archaeon]
MSRIWRLVIMFLIKVKFLIPKLFNLHLTLIIDWNRFETFLFSNFAKFKITLEEVYASTFLAEAILIESST